MSDWQPIVTAPREGSYLIWDGEVIATVEYRPAFKHPDHISHSETWVQISDSGRATVFAPTHWMPLPSPPTLQGT